MEQTLFEWKESYNIGVDIIDKAHKQLFSIVSRILRNFTDGEFEKNKRTIIEAIKYFEDYTVKHFAEEEAYQLSIGYKGYAKHKKIHDNMRNVVVPAMEKEIRLAGYSIESMEHVIGIFAGWLAAHVLIEDQAIVGKAESKWRQTAVSKDVDKLEEIVKATIKNLFRFLGTPVSKNYAGHQLAEAYYYEDRFDDGTGRIYKTTLAIERKVLLQIMTNLMDSKAMLEIDAVMHPMVKEILKSFDYTVVDEFFVEAMHPIESKPLSSDMFYSQFEDYYPDYSTLWRTEYGFMAFCISEEKVKKESE